MALPKAADLGLEKGSRGFPKQFWFLCLSSNNPCVYPVRVLLLRPLSPVVPLWGPCFGPNTTNTQTMLHAIGEMGENGMSCLSGWRQALPSNLGLELRISQLSSYWVIASPDVLFIICTASATAGGVGFLLPCTFRLQGSDR